MTADFTLGSLTPLVDAELRRLLDADTAARIYERDASVWTDADESKWLGWLDIERIQLSRLDELAALTESLNGFEHAVVLGMGGSSLCPEVLSLTFQGGTDSPHLRILDSTDPAQVKALDDSLDLSRTVFFEASKSGSTLEPTIFAAYFRARVAEVVGEESMGSHFIAVTDPGSQVEKAAAELSYRATFHGLPSIGGRYSALSDFGMVPGAAAGIDIATLLHRAHAMAQSCTSGGTDNPGLHLGTALGVAAREGRDKLTVLASPALTHFGAWLEQLIAESTGKDGHGIIPVDLEELGAPEVYGADRVFVHLRLESEPEPPGLDALAAAGHPVVRIVLTDVFELGAEIYRWEFATAVAGAVIGINPFDQPDVEASKVETRKLTDEYDQSGTLPDLHWFATSGSLRLTTDDANMKQLRADAADDSLEAIVTAHLARAGEGDYAAFLAYLPMTEENHALLNEIRLIVRDRRRVATCVGFGPRFQHSTGQAYKGGPNSGVFLQLTCTDTVDLPVPGRRYTFGIVKESQARGDFAVLSERDRRCLRLDLGDDPTAGLRVLKAMLENAL